MGDKRPRVSVVLTPAARQDIVDISRWSERQFGQVAARRYRALIIQALRDLEADPARPGAMKRPELMAPGALTYHLSLSRSRTGQPGVKKPRHFILYRAARPGFIEIARLLHDSCELQKHLPPGYTSEV